MIDWSRVKYFNPKTDKFPEDPNLYSDPNLIYALDLLREAYGYPIYPSPVKGALARLDGSSTSRHYAVGRKSDAIDIFPTKDKDKELYLAALSSNLFGGLGLYLDTRGLDGLPLPMLHVDLRPLNNNKMMLWVRDKKGNYIYSHKDNQRHLFFNKLSEFFS